MADIETLGQRRAGKSGDCRDWSVADALRKALQMVESGEAKAEMVYVAFVTAPSEGNRNYLYQCAGGSKLEMVGLLARHLHLTNEL